MIVFRNDTDYEPDCLPEIERASQLALKSEGIVCDAEISLIIANDNTLRELNRKFRGIDAATDVLSFPAYTLVPGDYGILDNEPEPVYLGDVAISIDRAISQSESYGHSLLRELAFLTVHSVLHLLGYDHQTPSEERLMFNKQEEILKNTGIIR